MSTGGPNPPSGSGEGPPGGGAGQPPDGVDEALVAIGRLSELALSGREAETVLSAAIGVVDRLIAADCTAVFDQAADGRITMPAGAGWSPGVVGKVAIDGDDPEADWLVGASDQTTLVELSPEPVRAGRGVALLRTNGIFNGLVVRIGPSEAPRRALATYARRRWEFNPTEIGLLAVVAGILESVQLRERTRQLEAELAALGRQASPEGPVDPGSAGRRILLVEDDVMVRRMAVRLLAEAGYEVATAANGQIALGLIGGGERVDVLLTDVAVGDMSGPELAKRLTLAHPEVRVVFMSGSVDGAEVGEEADRLEAAFVEKPFSRDSLIDGVRCALAGSA